MTKSVKIISESDMTDRSSFFIANVNKHPRELPQRRGNIYKCACRIKLTIRKGNR